MSTDSRVATLVRDLEANPAAGNAHTYQAIPFAEFSHLRSSIDPRTLAIKLALIKRVIAQRRGLRLPVESVLDIGANCGYFAFSLAPLVTRVTVYEPHERYGPLGKALAEVKAPNVDWRDRSFTAADARSGEWDVALMLSTFQWVAAGGTRMDEGLELLKALSRRADTLVFELGLNEGKSAITAHRRNHANELYEMLASHTHYKFISYVGAGRLWPARRPWKGLRHRFVCSHSQQFPEPRWAMVKKLRV